MQAEKLLVYVGIIFSFNVQAQDVCLGLLNHGLYDEFVTSGLSSNYSEMQNEICTAYQSYKNDVKGGSAKASYKLFSGEANYSSSKIESVGKFMCESNYGVENAISDTKEIRKQINSQAVSAFTQCVDNSKANLIVDTDYGASVFDATVISMRYSASGIGSGVPVESVQYDNNKLDCSGSLMILAESGGTLLNSSKSVRCVRKLPETPISVLGKDYWMLGTDITVTTGAETIVRRLPTVGVGPKPISDAEKRLKAVPPIGTIVAWSPTKVTVKNNSFGTIDSLIPPEGWEICNGKNGTPDLTGRFIRGAKKPGAVGGNEAVTASAGGHNHGTRQVPVGNGNGFGDDNLDNRFHTSGGTHSHSFSVLPPFYSVVYIMRVE